MQSVTSDQIREYVRKHYLEAARRGRKTRFTVRCGTVEKELGMSNRTNHVCSALKSRKFLEPNGLRLVQTDGPPSGMGTRVTYTFEFAKATSRAHPPEGKSVYQKLREMKGILHHVYKKLGGAEKAFQDEREGFSL